MSGTMRALRKTAPRPGAELVELPVPTPGEGEVLVRVHAASICGTDLHIYDWNEWAEKRIARLPMTFGHEVAGTIEAVGPEVHHLEPGAFVAAETHIACGQCSTCRTGRAHICENLRILGVDTEGAFAEYFVILPAENAWVVGEGIHPDVASIMEPFGNAVHAAFGTGGGEDIATNAVAVIGCGPDRAVRCWRSRDRSAPGRSSLSNRTPIGWTMASVMGADLLDRSASTDPVAAVMEASNGGGAEVVLEMSGNAEAIDQGTRMLARGGRLSLLGLPDGPVTLDLSRPGHLQRGSASRDHGSRDVPDLAADHHAPVHRPGRCLLRDHASVRAGAVRRSVRHHRLGTIGEGHPSPGGVSHGSA